jgi:hypothetical protein
MRQVFVAAMAASTMALGFGVGAARADDPGALAAGGYVQEFNYYGYNDIHPLSGPGSASIGGASLTVSTAPGGAVTAVTPGGTANGFFVVGSESYYAEVLGPSLAVPLRLYFNLSASSDAGVGTSYAVASVVFANTFFQVESRNGQDPWTTSGYLQATETTNTPFKISIGAESEYGGYAYADPLLEIDPTWAAANSDLASQVSLEFSDGVDNGFGVPSVPEPASWALMIVGFGLIGGSLRRRRLAPA